MLRPSALLMLVFTAIAVTFLVSCGDDDEDVGEPTIAVPQDTAPAPSLELGAQPEPAQPLDEQASPAEDGIISIDILGARFAPNRWSTALGESVTIRVQNGDTQQHNLRLAGLDGEFETQDDAVTVPEALGSGETGELAFVPQIAGDYTFRCDFHPAAMGGRIEVR